MTITTRQTTVDDQKFRKLPFMQVLLNTDLTVIDATDLYFKYTRIIRDNLVGKNLFAAFSHSKESTPDFIKNNILDAFRLKTPQHLPTVRFDLKKIDDPSKFETKFWSISSYPIVLGEKECVCHAVKDITEEVEQYEAINIGTRQDIFKLMITNMKDYAVFMLDATGHVSTWNKGAQRLKQYTAKEIIGKHFSVFYTQEDLEKGKPDLELKAAQIYGRTEDEYWRVRKDGTLFWSNVIITPLYDENHVLLGFFKVTRDLTERKANEQKVIQAFEDSSRLKAEFLANMSHEIRTPMNGIVSAVSLLKDSATKDQQDLINIIIQSSGIMTKLVNDILDYSKMESDRAYAESAPFDIVEEVNTTVHNYTEQSNKPIKMEISIHKDVPQMIKGDRLRLHQVISNLIDNAIKFTDEGQISVRLSVVSRNSMQLMLKFEIQDTGIGISKQNLIKLFTPFSQLDSFSTKRYKGTGLGLSICKRLIELMQGDISVESELGKGSKFIFIIPVTEYRQIQKVSIKTVPTSEEDVEYLQPSNPDAAILVAEDNNINQNVILRILRKLGYHNISLAVNGQEAVDKVHQHQFDIILMDIQMPVMDGHEATKLIRRDKFSIPIIAMTANVIKGDAEKCLEVGMNDYVPKPINFKFLSLVLKRWIRS